VRGARAARRARGGELLAVGARRPAPAKRLLALRALGLGDLLTALPALRALARAFPGHRRLLACPPALEPLVALAGTVHELVPAAPLEPLAGRAELHGVDVAVNLHGRGPQSHRLLRTLEPGRLIAFACPPEHPAGPSWRPGEHEVRRWCRMLAEHGIAADPDDLDLAPPPLAASPAAGASVIHPGAASAARRWPTGRFAAVARALATEGHEVLVTGGRGEEALAARVAALAGLPGADRLAGRLDLAGLVALVAHARLLVCGDTGVAHLATALRTPSVVLFGPVPPDEWGPPPRPWHRALWSGRRGDPHGGEVDPGLLALGTADVLAAVAALAAFRAPARPGSP
jgi:ADP-heptose:LPS heptosyltransferase